MTKDQFQKELEEKVTPGVKPSDLRKLKRSKSADDIPATPSSVPVSRSKSTEPFKDPQYPYTTLVSQQEELVALRKETTAKSDTIKLLRQKIENLEKTNPPHQLLQDQLSEKQQELESLRETSQNLKKVLKETLTELDNSLFARQQAVKQFGQIYEQLQKIKQELDENVNEASNELVSQDDQISRYRTQNQQAKLRIQSLEQDLNLTQRLVKLRKDSSFGYPDDYPNLNYLKYALYSLLAVSFTLYLANYLKNPRASPKSYD